MIQGGIRYVIDVSRAEGERITRIDYDGKPVQPGQSFIVVTNNYRASGGGNFPGIDGDNIVIDAPDANRDVLIEWVRQRRHLTLAANGSERPWTFAPLRTRGDVVFTSAAGKLAHARRAGLAGIRELREAGDGKAIYAIDLAAPQRP